MDAIIWIGNDHTVEVTGLHDEVTGDYLNAATVTATLKNMAGVAVSGETWPITLSYVAASNGDYRGTLEDGIVLVDGRSYILEIAVDAGGDLVAYWRKEVMAQYRTF